MMEELFFKLEELLNKGIESNIEKRTTIDSKLMEKLESIELFLTKYSYEHSYEFDAELLNVFIDELDFEGLKSARKYKSLIDYSSFCKSKNINGIFDFDISATNEIISKLITECKNLLSSKKEYIKKENEKNLQLDEKINFNKSVLCIIDKFKKERFLNFNDFGILINYLLTMEDQELSLLMASYITKVNAKYMEDEIKKAVLKQSVKNKIELSKSKVKEVKQTQSDQKDVLVDPEKKEKVKINNELMKLNLLTEEQQMLLQRAISISNLNDIAPSVELASNLLDKNMYWKDRVSIYTTIEDILLQKQLITYDINKNIIPTIEKKIRFKEVDVKTFDILQKALLMYDKLQQQENKKSKNYFEYLKENKQNETIEFLDNVTNLINQVMQLQTTNSKMFYQLNLGGLVSNLKDNLKSFTDSIELYYQGDFEYLELTEEYKEILETSYSDLKKLYENTFVKKEDMLEKGIQFYNSVKPVKNIFFFVNDDSVSSALEEDIEAETQFTDKTYSNVLNKLQLCVSDDFVATGNHRVKSTKYKNSFLEEYKVKSLVNGENRIFYSRFNSNVGTFIGIENFHMVFIYLVGYGASGGHKVDINSNALKRCYDKRNYIKSLVDLFNTDMEALNDNQREKTKEDIINILNQQYSKIGHFVSVCEEKKKQKREGATL